MSFFRYKFETCGCSSVLSGNVQSGQRSLYNQLHAYMQYFLLQRQYSTLLRHIVEGDRLLGVTERFFVCRSNMLVSHGKMLYGGVGPCRPLHHARHSTFTNCCCCTATTPAPPSTLSHTNTIYRELP